MAKNKGKSDEKGVFVYKSVKERKCLMLPPELHMLLKFEAMKQRKKLNEFLIEIIKDYLKI